VEVAYKNAAAAPFHCA